MSAARNLLSSAPHQWDRMIEIGEINRLQCVPTAPIAVSADMKRKVDECQMSLCDAEDFPAVRISASF
jgi:hypothetical protein